jgi:hypothetical protein
MTQLQAFQPIKAPHALHVHLPSFASQQHMHPPIAVARPGLGDFAHPMP